MIGGTTYNLVEGTLLPATVADSNTTAGSLSRIPDGEGYERRRLGLGLHDDSHPRRREVATGS